MSLVREYVRSKEVAGIINTWMNKHPECGVRDIAKAAGLSLKTVSAIYGQQRPLISLFLADKVLVSIGHNIEEVEIVTQEGKRGVLRSKDERDPFDVAEEGLLRMGWKLRIFSGNDIPREHRDGKIHTWTDPARATLFVAAPDGSHGEDVFWHLARRMALLHGLPGRDDLCSQSLLDAWAYDYAAQLRSKERARLQLRRMARRLSEARLQDGDRDKLAYALWPMLCVSRREERHSILGWFDEADGQVRERVEKIAKHWGWKAPRQAEKAWEYLQRPPL